MDPRVFCGVRNPFRSLVWRFRARENFFHCGDAASEMEADKKPSEDDGFA